MNADLPEISRQGGSILTFSGVVFYPLDPRADEIEIVDIAAALSNQCRFAGHVNEFYSVAQHSCLVSEALGKHSLAVQLWGLLHDAAEAYLIDVPGPLKRCEEFARYRLAEELIMRAVAERFELGWPVPAPVKDADVQLLHAEARQLSNAARDWAADDRRYKKQIVPWSPEFAKNTFLGRFRSLTHAMGRT